VAEGDLCEGESFYTRVKTAAFVAAGEGKREGKRRVKRKKRISSALDTEKEEGGPHL